LIVVVLLIAAFSYERRANGQSGGTVTTVSAASFAANAAVAADSIVSAFGKNLATRTEAASRQPLPTTLAGTQVKVNGQAAALFFVSPEQVNYLIPADTPVGTVNIEITSGDGTISRGTARIAAAAPALFTANSDGQGALASLLLRVRNGEFLYEPLSKYSETEKKFVTRPIDLSQSGDQLFLVLYLTGARQAPLGSLRVNIGGVDYLPSAIAAMPGLTGLDQINIPLPASFAGRGRITLLVKAAGASASNAGEFEISAESRAAEPNAPLVINELPSTPVTVGDEIEIGGSGFAANPFENTVQIVADDGVATNADVLAVAGDSLRVRVPFGAGTGLIRVLRGTSEASAKIEVRTSISGFIEEAKMQDDGSIIRVPIPGAHVRLVGNPASERAVSDDGSFVLPGAPEGQNLVDVVPPPSSLNYPHLRQRITVRLNRDNQLPRATELTQAGNTQFPAQAESANALIAAPDAQLIFLLPGRTPVNLPVGHFSTRIAQITPFGVPITPATRLSFPNADAIPIGAQARLFKFDQRAGSETLGTFIDIGEATVSAGGQRVDTAPGAITEGSYYFVSIARPTAAINGRVLESDGRPVPRAVVQARGQSTFTDGYGGFVLRDVPVMKPNGDRAKVEVSYQRPNGSISRKDSGEVELIAGELASLKLEVVLDPVTVNFAPVILAPSSLTLVAGETREFDFIVTDPDSAEAPRVSLSGSATGFATIGNQGGGVYRLRLAPAANAAGGYTLAVTAVDGANERGARGIALTVNQPNSTTPIAQGQSIAMLEDASKSIALAGGDPAGRPLTYTIVNRPARGTLSGAPPALVYTPARNFNGADSFTFKVSNGAAESLPATVFIAIGPVNDAPVLDLPESLAINTGEMLNLKIAAFDVDGGQRLRFTATGLPPGATLAGTGSASRLLNWTPVFLQAGLHTLSFSVIDDGAPPLGDARTMKITVEAKWAPTSGPEGGKVSALVSKGNTVLASTYGGGVFRSTTNGRTWAPANAGLVDGDQLDRRFVHTMAVSGPLVLAGTNGAGIFHSNNDGQSWTRVTNGTINSFVYGLASAGDSVFAATFGGIYRSTDNGRTWTLLLNGIPARSFRDITAIGSNVYTEGYRSTDNGDSWTETPPGTPRFARGAVVSLGSTIYAGTLDEGVLRSNDGGKTWTPVNNGLDSRLIRSLVAIGANLVAVMENTRSIFLSANGGDQWTRAGQSPGADIYVASGNLLVAGRSPLGTSFSVDFGNQWTPSSGMSQTVVNALFVSGGKIFAGTEIGISISTDDGQSWTNVSGNNVRVFHDNGSLLFAGTGGSGIYVSADGGLNWVLSDRGLDGQTRCIGHLASIGATVFAAPLSGPSFSCGNRTGLIRSTDNGGSWKIIAFEEEGAGPLALRGNTLLVSTRSGPQRSTDKGESWTPARNGLPDPTRTSIAALTVSGAAIFAWISDGDVYRTTDDGQNWTRMGRVPSSGFYYTLIADGTNLYAGTFQGAFQSVDEGRTWTPLLNGLTNKVVQALILNRGSLLAGTGGNGVFRLD
jgi:uncharacterized protein (TIGR03437 family)